MTPKIKTGLRSRSSRSVSDGGFSSREVLVLSLPPEVHDVSVQRWRPSLKRRFLQGLQGEKYPLLVQPQSKSQGLK